MCANRYDFTGIVVGEIEKKKEYSDILHDPHGSHKNLVIEKTAKT